ncbi:YozE family protein [Priestia koreensis]|uniref:YozE family protein n=1 Tax=Priestia koreensis TaxID=284581 RepID=UPI001F58D6D1|nr:YozE family protein [Priestia koreensis]MCM3003435.1 YozE family protein [Priestia koreensis]UNL86225.1 YozE family protein [Priestia koreensis]
MKSFYHYLMKYRANKKNDALGEFARAAYDDHSFPKMETDYNEISSYLEMNGHYLPSMSVFDEAWELYQSEEAVPYLQN